MVEPNDEAIRILIIEDDFMYSEDLAALMAGAFHKVAITIVETETALLSRVDDLANEPPDIIVTDMMLRWTDDPEASGNMPLNHDVMFGGARCIKAIRERDALSNIPILIVTASTSRMYQDRLPNPPRSIEILEKPVLPGRLIAVVRSLVAAHTRPPRPRKKGFVSQVWEAIDLSPGVGGMNLNIKKLLK